MSLPLAFSLNLSATPDEFPPSLTSATIASSGTSISLLFNESVNVGAGGNGGWSISAPAGAATLSYVSGSGSDTLVYSISRTIRSTETGVTIAYTQPGNGIEDAYGNDLVSLSDQAVVNGSTQNAAPTSISLSNATISPTAGTNAVVGTLSASDTDYAEIITFSLVSGTGSTDNASFNISGSSLRCNDPAALGASTRSVRVRATDSASNTVEQAFTVTIADQIAFVGSATGTNSLTIPSHQSGDIIVMFASRDGSTTAPSIPSGWTSIITGGANSLGYATAYKVAASASETSGTWTNATSCGAVVYRPSAGYTMSIGGYASGVNSTGTNALYPAFTLQNTAGNSVVVCFYAHRSTDIGLSTATATGLTVREFNQDATDTLAIHTTTSTVTSWSGATVTYTGTSSTRRYVAVEVYADVVESASGDIGLQRDTVQDLVRSLTRDLVG